MASEAASVRLSQHGCIFPLNVYACLLGLESAKVEGLHFGLFESSGMSAAVAQRRATDLLSQHLQPPFGKLLNVGVGGARHHLRGADYDVHSISPVVEQGRYSEGVLAPFCRLEDFDSNAGKWRTLLFHQGTRYTDCIDLFERAAYLLADDGEILIMDEFALVRDRDELKCFHYLDHFLRLAKRFGFDCVTSLDLSVQAAPTLDWLIERCRKHSVILERELSVGEVQLVDIEESCLAHRKRYAERQCGYFLLRLRRSSRPIWQVGRITIASSRHMRALFAEVFEHEMSSAHWQWKYGEGRGLSIGVWATSARGSQAATFPHLVAHYGGLVRNIRYLGQEAKALQCCDVMVASAGRASLSRRGPIFLAAATCLEHDVGYGTPHRIGFGFPNKRAYKLPERLGLYTEVGRMVAATWAPILARPTVRVVARELVGIDCGVVDKCWRAMLASVGDFIVGERDSRHMRHRYLDHPDKEYRLYAIRNRFGGMPLGILVLRRHQDSASDSSTCELLDVVGAKHHMPVLVHHARRIAAQWGCDRLYAWMSCNLLPLFDPQGGAKVDDLDISIPANTWSSGPPIEEQRDRWWLMGGDTDFR